MQEYDVKRAWFIKKKKTRLTRVAMLQLQGDWFVRDEKFCRKIILHRKRLLLSCIAVREQCAIREIAHFYAYTLGVHYEQEHRWI